MTVVGAVGSVLERKDTLALTSTDVGLAASAYLAGAVVGALGFGRATDVLGRKRLFLVTLFVYLAATVATSASWSFGSFAFFRFVTGMGIGGEYAAINSAIDELLPARVRGHADLAINGSFWVGTALGAAVSSLFLDERVLGARLGWRAAFGLGAVLGGAVMLVRRYVPESPRWLLFHGRVAEAEAIVAEIEMHAGVKPPATPLRKTAIDPKGALGWREVARVLLRVHPRRTVFGLVLMIAQAFFYNAIFFTYALVLTTFYDVPDAKVGFYIFPFAVGNFLGPLVLGRLFDTVGRRRMIAATYAGSAVLLALTAWAFTRGWLDATTQTAAWSAIFFVASAAASAAYLTVSEIFPMEMRAIAIAIFYAVGTGAGGVAAPAFFGALVESKSRTAVAIGYAVGVALMAIAAVLALVLGVDAERKPLEDLR